MHFSLWQFEEPLCSFICELCGLGFCDNISLKCHRHIHTGEKLFKFDLCKLCLSLKDGLYRIWCGVNTLGDTSALVNPTVQLLLTRRGNIRMDGLGIVF